VSAVFSRVLGVLRGDKYMANAYPPEWRDPRNTGEPDLHDPDAPPVPATTER
jgi:hypothetical protein